MASHLIGTKQLLFFFRWSELTVWPQGALVKHVRGLFKAEGVNITAEPGNSMHGRFYVSRKVQSSLAFCKCCCMDIIVKHPHNNKFSC